MDPIDAGTDNGFTFTAPNWPTEPQGEAYRITAHYPAHPAGSFFYPYLKRLPPIGTFQFIKVMSYKFATRTAYVGGEMNRKCPRTGFMGTRDASTYKPLLKVSCSCLPRNCEVNLP